MAVGVTWPAVIVQPVKQLLAGTFPTFSTVFLILNENWSTTAAFPVTLFFIDEIQHEGLMIAIKNPILSRFPVLMQLCQWGIYCVPAMEGAIVTKASSRHLFLILGPHYGYIRPENLDRIGPRLTQSFPS